MGGKKLGLGAQKIHTNFADIEKEAELADKIRFSEPVKKTESVGKSNEDQESQVWLILIFWFNKRFLKLKWTY